MSDIPIKYAESSRDGRRCITASLDRRINDSSVTAGIHLSATADTKEEARALLLNTLASIGLVINDDSHHPGRSA